MARRGRPELNLSDNVTTQFKLLLSLTKNKEQLKNWSVMSVKQLPVASLLSQGIFFFFRCRIQI